MSRLAQVRLWPCIIFGNLEAFNGYLEQYLKLKIQRRKKNKETQLSNVENSNNYKREGKKGHFGSAQRQQKNLVTNENDSQERNATFSCLYFLFN